MTSGFKGMNGPFEKKELQLEVEGLRKQLTNALEEVRKGQKQLAEKEELRKLAEQKSTRLVKLIDTLEKEAGVKQVKFQELKKELTTVKGQKALLELKHEHAVTQLLKSKEDTIFWKDMELDGLRKLTELAPPLPPVSSDEGGVPNSSSATWDDLNAKESSLGTTQSGEVASGSTTASAVGTASVNRTKVKEPTEQKGKQELPSKSGHPGLGGTQGKDLCPRPPPLQALVKMVFNVQLAVDILIVCIGMLFGFIMGQTGTGGPQYVIHGDLHITIGDIVLGDKYGNGATVVEELVKAVINKTMPLKN